MALGELRDPAAVPRVAAAAAEDEKDIRKTAFFALGAIGDPSAIPTLIKALERPGADVRWNAAVALSRFGDRGPSRLCARCSTAPGWTGSAACARTRRKTP
jgi:HEAT repeat protein